MRIKGVTGENDMNTEDEAKIEAPNPPGYPGPCPDGMDWSEWLAFNNVD